jgi:mannose-6-phosphate isomerase-like protein (cupin superfamily)
VLDLEDHMPDPLSPFAVRAGEGRIATTLTGDSACIKTDTQNTFGSLTVMELTISPKLGPALHTHVREDEVWYVLEGEFRFKAGDLMFAASAGDMAFGPRGTPHNFQNVGETPGRLLVVTTPSGTERLFDEYTKLLPGPVDPETIAALTHANWVDFVGPPLAVSDPL